MTIHDTIAQIEALEKKATPGPWVGDRYDGTVKYSILGGPDRVDVIKGDNHNNDYGPYGVMNSQDEHFIMAIRNAAPSLIAYIRALEKVSYEAEQLCMIKQSAELEKALAAAREAGK